MNDNIIKKYEAMGFVEALMAIMIAGMASVVLMGIAAKALKEAVQNERIDKMTQYAVEGANMTTSAIQNPDNAGLVFSNVENCYIPVPVVGNQSSYTFHKTNNQYWLLRSSNLIVNNIIQRGPLSRVPKVIDGGANSTESQFVRIACIKKNTGYLTIRIGIAHLPSSGKITNDKEIRDYFYTTTIEYENI